MRVMTCASFAQGVAGCGATLPPKAKAAEPRVWRDPTASECFGQPTLPRVLLRELDFLLHDLCQDRHAVLDSQALYLAVLQLAAEVQERQPRGMQRVLVRPRGRGQAEESRPRPRTPLGHVTVAHMRTPVPDAKTAPEQRTRPRPRAARRLPIADACLTARNAPARRRRWVCLRASRPVRPRQFSHQPAGPNHNSG